jgi:putative membrane protein
MTTGGPEVDYRFTLANERTYLAWIRTAVALLAGGVAAAKALDFDHEAVRWAIAVPPMAAGALLALEARRRLRAYAAAMERGAPLPVGRRPGLMAVAVAAYATLVLLATVLDG